MATPSRRDAAGLRHELLDQIRQFEFFQAVRILEQLWPARAEVGEDTDPDDELVRFRSQISLAFPRGDVSAIEAPREDVPAEMVVNFMGVATPASFGSLPLPYAEEILNQSREGNEALRDFLDLFNHRLVSLFYRAWKKARLAPMYESRGESYFERALRGVIGMGTGGLGGRLPLHDHALLARAGLLAMAPAPPLALQGLVKSYFGAPSEVIPFRAQWYPVDEEDRSRLGRAHCRVGVDLAIGARVLSAQSKFRLRLGPLARAEYEDFLPRGAAVEPLRQLVRLACGVSFDFELQLVLRAADVPPLQLASDLEPPLRLGCTTWLAHRREADADDAVFQAGTQLSDDLAEAA